MGEQLDLFGAPRVAGSDTSAAAAELIEPTAGTLRHKVLSYLRKRCQAGATDEQMQLTLGMNPSTQRPRRIELVRAGLVWDSNRRRKTTSGRQAAVWVSSKRWVEVSDE